MKRDSTWESWHSDIPEQQKTLENLSCEKKNIPDLSWILQVWYLKLRGLVSCHIIIAFFERGFIFVHPRYKLMVIQKTDLYIYIKVCNFLKKR